MGVDFSQGPSSRQKHEPFSQSGEITLSRQARSLWGKSDGMEGERWLPLYMHMLDSTDIAGYLWDEWLPEGVRSLLTQALGEDPGRARKLACFIAGIHDIGKATPSFQGMPCGKCGITLDYRARKAGLPIGPEATGHRRVAHPIGSYLVLLEVLVGAYGWQPCCAKSVAAVVGGHHGKPPAAKDVPGGIREEEMPQRYGLGWDADCGDSWTSAQAELVEMVAQAAGLTEGELAECAGTFIPAPVASLMTGFVIMADWLASDQDLFPLISSGCDDDEIGDARLRTQPSTRREASRWARGAWERVGLIPAWHEGAAPALPVEELYRERFNFSESMRARPVQRAAVEVARSVETPGLIIIEAPMGEGKTEAALAAAEILATRTGRGGVCIALPTMATTDAMFARVHRWLERLPSDGDDARSVYLAHGKARLNEGFQGLQRSGRRWDLGLMGEDLQEEGAVSRGGSLHVQRDAVVVSQWMQGRKKGMLANFVVCTVDQVLMGALEMKHLSLRQLALANKVVVIDECHAYDSYMRCYLNRVLGWLGAMGVPVLLLSATLPKSQREEMLESYQKGQRAHERPKEPPKRMGPPRLRGKRAAASTLPEEKSADVAMAACKADDDPRTADAYPLITYTDGDKPAVHVAPEPSGRTLEVSIELLDDTDETLIALMGERLGEGGCAGVICTTVKRAQHAAQVLRDAFGNAAVVLAHARFTDIDRMTIETLLRGLLGPDSTRENGRRPERLIVVGTQVLEQSLDIDFDVMVSDIGPVDLVMQRIGRLHRHVRRRPSKLERACCYVRGVEGWEVDGPVFAGGVNKVYPTATLMEALGVLGLTGEGAACSASLPADIARTVRDAYEGRVALPPAWGESYEDAREKRKAEESNKQNRADACLLRDVSLMVGDGDTLVGWYTAKNLETRDQDYGPRAVRDTGETVEVLALELRGQEVRLLPWVGDEEAGVECGAQVDTGCVPDDATAQLAAQSAVRLPQSLCRHERIEGLINELEEACGSLVGSWQESPWLAGCLPLLLERDEQGRLSTTLCGWTVVYSRNEGLVVERREAIM